MTYLSKGWQNAVFMDVDYLIFLYFIQFPDKYILPLKPLKYILPA